MNGTEPDYSGLAPDDDEFEASGVSSLLYLRSRIVPVWFWRRVDDSTARVYGVKVKIHEQQRRKELDVDFRQSRAEASRSPYPCTKSSQAKKRKKGHCQTSVLASSCSVGQKRTCPPSQIREMAFGLRSRRIEFPRIRVQRRIQVDI